MDVKIEAKEKTQDRLERLGFKTAASKIKELSARKRKMMIAAEFYRIVRPEKIDEFNRRLRAKTERRSQSGSWAVEWDQLSFTPLDRYPDAPPSDVLDALELADSRKCFDSFEIAHIVKEVKMPDPILFGCIQGCSDKFYIAQWLDDVAIEDILSTNEG
jgi:hypothetical protein